MDDEALKYPGKIKRKNANRFSFKRGAGSGGGRGHDDRKSTSTCILNPIHEVSWSELRLINSQYSIQDPFDEYPYEHAASTACPQTQTLV